jgi:uncharacterized protein YcbK (DUF882 family)
MNRTYIYILISIPLMFLILFSVLFTTYFNNISGVDPQTQRYYAELKSKLIEKGFLDNIIVVSGTRWKWHNDLLHYFETGAAKQSFHLKSKAIDIIVRDVNDDGKSNKEDVLIVKELLENEIVGSEGGVGIYLKSNNFFSRQMVHFDCRGYRARWNY